MAAGRLLLPEWSPQSGVLLAWPHEGTDWARDLEAAEAAWTALAAAIAGFEPVLVICADAAHRRHVRQRLAAAGVTPDRLRLVEHRVDDTWTRDYGPLCVAEAGRVRLVDFAFNGWGGKFPAARDDAASRRLHAAGCFGDTPLERVELVLEGGALDTDGAGTALTTRSCLLNPNRALPGGAPPDKPLLETRLRTHLGLRRVIWLEHGRLAGDDTDGHVDMLALFCSPAVVAHAACDRAADEHHAPLARMAEELARALADGPRPVRLVPLPLPAPVRDEDGRRLPATYVNFLILNGAVLVPAYGDPADELALRRLRGCFPGRRVIPVDCRVLIRQGGGLHCAALQLARGVLAKE